MHTQQFSLTTELESHSYGERSPGTDDSTTFPYPDRPDIPGNVTLGEN
jgi:hypothetical protein